MSSLSCASVVFVCVVVIFSCRSSRHDTCLTVSPLIQVFVEFADEMQPQLDLSTTAGVLLQRTQGHIIIHRRLSYALKAIKLQSFLDQRHGHTMGKVTTLFGCCSVPEERCIS
jgi:hypothetical protein